MSLLRSPKLAWLMLLLGLAGGAAITWEVSIQNTAVGLSLIAISLAYVFIYARSYTSVRECLSAAALAAFMIALGALTGCALNGFSSLASALVGISVALVSLAYIAFLEAIGG